MLPITNQSPFHIPHSIATVAAVLAMIVALITALGLDVSGSEATGLNPVGSTLDHVSSVTPQEPSPPGEAPVPARAGSAEPEATGLSGLLPLVLPSISGF